MLAAVSLAIAAAFLQGRHLVSASHENSCMSNQTCNSDDFFSKMTFHKLSKISKLDK